MSDNLAPSDRPHVEAARRLLASFGDGTLAVPASYSTERALYDAARTLLGVLDKIAPKGDEMPERGDVIHDPLRDWCACEPMGTRRCGYRLLADAVVEAFNPPDGDEAEVAICAEAVKTAAEYVRDQPCLCAPDARYGACPRCRALGQRDGKPVDR